MERIRYAGLSLTPDEQLVDNGALSLCANMELYNGALRPAVIAGTATQQPLQMQDGHTPVQLSYVHETTTYRHYIGQAKQTQQALFWFYKDGTRGGVIHTFGENVTISDVNSVGNTIIICATDGIHYARWMPNERTYKYIGQKPPFVKLSFSMDGPQETEYEIPKDFKGKYFGSIANLRSFEDIGKTIAFRIAEQLQPTQVFKASEGDGAMDPGKVDIIEEYQAQVTEEVWALINKTHAKIAEDGHFYAPFFIRYCYRMYDGSMLMHSAPIFIPTKMNNTAKVKTLNVGIGANNQWDINNNTHIKNKTGNNSYKDVSLQDKTIFYFEPYCASLKWMAVNDGTWETIQEDWKDLIQSLDIFITPPITELDSAELIQTMSKEDYSNIYYNGYTKIAQDIRFALSGGVVQEHLGTTVTTTVATFDIPSLSQKAFYDKISNQAAFFKLKSISTDKELPHTMYQDMDLDKTVVRYIAAQEAMKDDYKSHNTLYAKGMFVYNRRVNTYGLKEKLFEGFNAITLMPENYGDHLTTTYTSLGYANYNAAIQKIAVVLQTEDGQKTVVVNEKLNRWVGLIMLLNSPLFYPDNRAVKMILQYKMTTTSEVIIVERDMVQCNELNGAMTVMGNFLSINPDAENRRQIGSFNFETDNVVEMPSKIYTSEINNPYVFPVNGINTVGIGEIKGLAAATRALSQGQYGQFPLMAFTSDGIWALSVSQTATFSAINPISREVCSNDQSITPIDQSVVFVTDRAINRVRESDVVDFSKNLNGPYFNIQQKMPRLHEWMSENMPAFLPVLEYEHSPIDAFQTAHILYDYTNQRLLVFPDITQQHVVIFTYSLVSDTWALILINNNTNTILALPSQETSNDEIQNEDIIHTESPNNDNILTDFQTPTEGNGDDDTGVSTGNEDDPSIDDNNGTIDGGDDSGNQNPDDPNNDDPEIIDDDTDTPYIDIVPDDGEEPVRPDEPDDPDDPVVPYIRCERCGADILDYPCPVCGYDINDEPPGGDEPDEPDDPDDPVVPYIRCERCGADILDYPCPVCGYDINDEPPGGDEPDDPDDPDDPDTPAIISVLNGYPFPYIQKANGTVICMDIPYNLLYQNSTIHQGIVLTRTLKFSEVMNAVSAYCQENDMAQQPTLFFFGSNDNINWRYVGKTNRRKADYIPGHSYRYFRIAIAFENMTASEMYYETQLGITPKYKKT